MITIVIPVRDRASVVRRTLESVRRQTLRPLSVVLVDNGSTDGTLDVLRQWQSEHQAPDFDVMVLEEPHPGATIARNTGLEAVATEWTMFFDSDDTMAPTHVAEALACATAHPDADIVGWDVAYADGQGRQSVKPFYVTDVLYHSVQHGGMATLRYMARTELFRRVGGWRPDVLYWNDIELSTRLLTSHPAPVVCKRPGAPLVTVSVSPDSITGASFSQRAERALHSLDCMEQTVGPCLKPIIDLKRAILAANCWREGDKATAASIMQSALQGATPGQHIVLKSAYRYTRLGLRGAARLLRPFMP